MEPRKQRSIIHIDSETADIDNSYRPSVELIGAIGPTTTALAALVKHAGPHPDMTKMLAHKTICGCATQATTSVRWPSRSVGCDSVGCSPRDRAKKWTGSWNRKQQNRAPKWLSVRRDQVTLEFAIPVSLCADSETIAIFSHC